MTVVADVAVAAVTFAALYVWEHAYRRRAVALPASSPQPRTARRSTESGRATEQRRGQVEAPGGRRFTGPVDVAAPPSDTVDVEERLAGHLPRRLP